MWNCRSCGCQAIASDLMACPHCGLPRRETSMARISVGEGASNAADPDVEQEAPPAKSAPKDEHVDYAVRVLGLSQEDAEGLTKADLIDLEHADDEDEEGSSSAGTSSSASESKQDKSGSTHQETGQSTQSPASSAESHSGGPRQSSQGSPSTAHSTGGRTQGTGHSQPGQQSSSGATSQDDEHLTKGRGGRQ
jgi:hypothetical protein